jgi:hypothetical protein
MSYKNLYWQTRCLTDAREDHLTYFLAAALGCDPTFRHGYERDVLASVARDTTPPRIDDVDTQATFQDQSCRPDLLLRLADGRVIICEHKIDAPETTLLLDTGEIRGQLERYLELPVDGVAYFRSALVTIPRAIMDHDRYIRPPNQPHFLWRDIYHALSTGEHAITRWLFEGFRQQGFTPAVPHVGDLWPDEIEEVKENQRNFGKLWHSGRAHASQRWKVAAGRRCELYLLPLSPMVLCSRIYISPIAQNGSLLRFRCETTDEQAQAVRDMLAKAGARLPSSPEVVSGRLQNGLPFVDLLMSLFTLLAGADTSGEQEARLFAQVTPLIDVLSAAA